MVTTFSRKECDDILHPALHAVLPALGVNHHFPRDMIYGHADHFGLAIPNLYDSQGFSHLSTLLKFGTSPCTMGQLLWQTYETLQIEVGLPGELLTQAYSPWASLCTKSWLTHTWQYASENGWEIVTGLPSLPYKCNNDQFLMELFWHKGYCGQQLVDLNHCRLWLQVSSLADIVDGWGTHVVPAILLGKKSHLSPNSHQWPTQAPPTQGQWMLWWQALCASLSLNDLLKLPSPLGIWAISPDLWDWFWSEADECLYEWHNHSWRVWIPLSRTHHHGQHF